MPFVESLSNYIYASISSARTVFATLRSYHCSRDAAIQKPRMVSIQNHRYADSSIHVGITLLNVNKFNEFYTELRLI